MYLTYPNVFALLQAVKTRSDLALDVLQKGWKGLNGIVTYEMGGAS